MLQLLFPIVILLIARSLGFGGHPVTVALVLMFAAPSIMGSPNLVMMLGAGPDHALRLMVLGTLLVPVTIWPIFALAPDLGGAAAVVPTALTLLLTIGVTSSAALILRATILRTPSQRTEQRLSGLSSVTLAIFVIGLMPQVSKVALSDPAQLLAWGALAFAANFGAQALVWLCSKDQPRDSRIALSLIAGNRNISLFLVSLPPDVTAPILVFIGCYQIPMFLTPIVLKRVYAERLT